MKTKLIVVITLFLTSCGVSIPRETVDLSKVIGQDIVALHNSHINLVDLFYQKIEDDINKFIDDIYAPYIIHYVLKDELVAYQKGEESLYGTIEKAGRSGNKKETTEALNTMVEFQEEAYSMIDSKRNELLYPILKEKRRLINQTNKSYENVIYANSTITGYLESIRKVKESQNEALSILGIKDEYVIDTFVKISKETTELLKKAKDIDIKSDDAYEQIENITKQVKSIINKK